MSRMNRTWLTSEAEYEGFPLLLRKPHFKNIWKFQNQLPILFTVTQTLLEVQEDGLPVAHYNSSLIQLDDLLCKLFDNNREGIIFLIETFGGNRHYYYYISEVTKYKAKLQLIKRKFRNERLGVSIKKDKDWGFITKYPFALYEK